MPPVMELDSLNTSRHRRSEQGADSFPENFTLRPHEGYRKYFDGSLRLSDVAALFDEHDSTSQFPSVRYAAGWTYADHAISSRNLSLDGRLDYIDAAEQRWQEAIDLTSKIYEALPGRFLLWPCTKWRYQFAVDTIPTLQAIAYAKNERSRRFNRTLLEESRENVNSTIQKLMGKYAWTLEHYTLKQPETLSKAQLDGRLGAITGVALEGAVLSAAQLAGEDAFAVLPPSLRLDTGKSAEAVDVVAHTTRDMTFSAQIKQRVDTADRKKYRNLALVCARHHMVQQGESVTDVIEFIGNDENLERVRDIGEVILRVMQGSQKHGCSEYNPRPAHTLNHRNRMRAA